MGCQEATVCIFHSLHDVQAFMKLYETRHLVIKIIYWKRKLAYLRFGGTGAHTKSITISYILGYHK